MKRTLLLFASVVSIIAAPSQHALAQWVQAGDLQSPNAIATNGSTVYAGTSAGMFRSTDDGTTWTEINNGFPKDWVGSILPAGNDLYAGTVPGQGANPVDTGTVFRSTDNGAHWTKTGLTRADVSCLLMVGTNLYAGLDGNTGPGGVCMSTDNGTTWTPITTGLLGTRISTMAVSGTTLYAGSERGVYMSTNGGTTWMSAGLSSYFIATLLFNGGTLYAGTFGHGVFVSTNNGTTWKPANNGISATSYTYGMTASGTNVFVGNGSGAFLSTNGGTSWTAVNTGLPGNGANGLGGLVVNATYIFGGNAGVYRRPLADFISSGVSAVAASPSTIELSPNPTNGMITVRARTGNEIRATVENVLGQRVSAASVHGSDLSLDLSSVPAGAYYVRITVDGVATTRMIVRR